MAATAIVGGIVIAALDTVPISEFEISRDAVTDPAGSPTIGAPLHRAALSAPAARESEPPLERIERSMEHH